LDAVALVLGCWTDPNGEFVTGVLMTFLKKNFFLIYKSFSYFLDILI